MNASDQPSEEVIEARSSKWIFPTAVAIGAIFWVSLFGLIFLCLKAEFFFTQSVVPTNRQVVFCPAQPAGLMAVA